MKKIVLILMIALCSCVNATVDNGYNQNLAQWMGKPQWLLFKRWGTPDEQFSVDAGTYVVSYTKIYKASAWNRSKIYAKELSSEVMGIGPGYGTSQQPQIYYCKTSFTLQNGIVTDYGFNGDNCV